MSSKSPSSFAPKAPLGLLDARSVPRTKVRGLSNTSTLKEFRTIFAGAAVIVFVTSVLNLLLNFDITLSLLIAIISGVIVGLLINSRGR